MVKKIMNLLKKIYAEIWILLAIAVLMASAIYWRIESARKLVEFSNVLIWQLIIWLPLVIFAFYRKYYYGKNYFSRNWINYLLLVLFLVFHLGWFVVIGNNFSPYLNFPETRYGVYPFFFIFWLIIDVIIIALLVLFYRHIDLLSSSEEKGIVNIKVLEVKERGKTSLISIEEIIWIEADGYCARIHTDEHKYHVRLSLKEIYYNLPAEDFIQIHRSAIINVSHLKALEHASIAVMKNGDKVKISRAGLSRLKSALKKHTL